MLNTGSSSQKSCFYDLGEKLPEAPPAPCWEAHLEWKGSLQNAPRLRCLPSHPAVPHRSHGRVAWRLDALVFTAGTGEDSPLVREAACQDFEFLGLQIGPQKNAQSPADQDISTGDSAVRVVVVAAREDWEIARECWRLARASART